MRSSGLSLCGSRGRRGGRGRRFSGRGSCCMPPRGWRTRRSRSGWIRHRGLLASGEDGSPSVGLRVWRTSLARVALVVYPPEQVAAVKAVACELPIRYGLPLSRFCRTELHRLVIELAISDASASTIWRWLHDDALKPWQTRSWLTSWRIEIVRTRALPALLPPASCPVFPAAPRRDEYHEPAR